MWLIVIISVALLLIIGFGRTIFKGQFNSLRNVLVTMFFLDVMFDDWDGDSDISDVDF